MVVKVSPKYQVVIPEKIRASLGLVAGAEVDVLLKGGVVFLVPVPKLQTLQNKMKGKLDGSSLREKKDRKL